jgi:nucleoside-diphosphate-sugar epimerase
MAKTVLVTGASGFIGSHLVNRCLRDGCRVKALVRKGTSRIAALRASGVEVVVGDVRDASAVDAAARGCELVIHAAGLTSDWGLKQEFIDINVGGTRNVCESSLRHGVGRLVYISTSDCFDQLALDRIDERTPYATNPSIYGATKIGGTQEVWAAKQKGLSVSILYPTWVYGPGDRTLFSLLADSIRRRQLFFWSRNAPMCMIYIDNLVDLVMLAATHPAAAGEDFAASDGEAITFEEVSRRVALAIGAPVPSLHLPFGLVRRIAGAMEFTCRIAGSAKRPLLTRQAVDVLAARVFVDSSKARRMLGWQSVVPQDEGILRTLDWLLTVDPSQWKLK